MFLVNVLIQEHKKETYSYSNYTNLHFPHPTHTHTHTVDVPVSAVHYTFLLVTHHAVRTDDTLYTFKSLNGEA